MQYRFDGRFDYSIDITPKAEQLLVPKLILQPLLENALKYGLEQKLHLELKIRSTLNDEGLQLSVSDNGPGIPPEMLAALRRFFAQNEPPAGYAGLYNVHRCIQLLCGETYGLEVQSGPGSGTTIIIRLPAMGEEQIKN